MHVVWICLGRCMGPVQESWLLCAQALPLAAACLHGVESQVVCVEAQEHLAASAAPQELHNKVLVDEHAALDFVYPQSGCLPVRSARRPCMR